MIPAEVIDRARDVLSDKRYETWHARHVQRFTIEEIMFRQNLHKSSVRDRLSAAHLDLLRAGVRYDEGRGIYYLEDAA